MSKKRVYFFGAPKAEGDKDMKQLLGGKGANLCEMVNLGIPVPPGFIISTEVCAEYNKTKSFSEDVRLQIKESMKKVEKAVGKKFGDASNPLLLSVRSGAAVSMPGMMDTILNLGLNDTTVAEFSKLTNNERFVWDSYRRFIAMYSNVVMQLNMHPFEHELETTKKRLGIKADCDIPLEDLKEVVLKYKDLFREASGKDFPTDPQEQLYASISAVFRSWDNPRAVRYRKMYNIAGLLGTAVNIQAMVFGNMSNDSATGVCFSRDPSNGDPGFYGEYLINAQGEDVVAGIRTPQQIRTAVSKSWAKENNIPEDKRRREFPSMEESMPRCYKQLVDVRDRLERHFRDMQDMEFTIEKGKLWLLQTRNGKRTMLAATKIAVSMVKEGLISEKEAVMRIDPKEVDQLLHPMIDPKHNLPLLAKGLPASPGAGVGKIVFNAEDAEKWHHEGKKVIMVRIETSPEDLGGMSAAQAILTARGGMTSHAAVVARGMGKTCVSGCGDLIIDYAKKTVTIKGKVFHQGDWISVDGTKGHVYQGKAKLVKTDIKGDFGTIITWAKKFKRLGVRANADTPKDAEVAFSFGAEGVGLCRTEHMFFEGNRIDAMREMILADSVDERKKALEKILPLQKGDFIGIFKAMKGNPCTIRLLDPPLHEFLPHDDKSQQLLSETIGVPVDTIARRVKELHEFNPMLGHRGVRLGITYPEIYNTQVEAIMEAACEVQKSGLRCEPEIMIPIVGKAEELIFARDQCEAVCKEVIQRHGTDIRYHVGTMIEVPRAAVTADRIAKHADFFSFGTNDLTQMGCGFSRDDAASFLKPYVEKGIYKVDPFQSVDQEGVGELIRIAVAKGRGVKPNLKLGVCGEHGGDPDSIVFFHKTGLSYVSCSPYRVPAAIIAAARAAISHPQPAGAAGAKKAKL